MFTQKLWKFYVAFLNLGMRLVLASTEDLWPAFSCTVDCRLAIWQESRFAGYKGRRDQGNKGRVSDDKDLIEAHTSQRDFKDIWKESRELQGFWSYLLRGSMTNSFHLQRWMNILLFEQRHRPCADLASNESVNKFRICDNIFAISSRLPLSHSRLNTTQAPRTTNYSTCV